jgi:hypothetical protein
VSKKKKVFNFRVRIDPRGKPFKTMQVFRVPAVDECEAEFELKRMFKHFAYHHGWGAGYTVKEIKAA